MLPEGETQRNHPLSHPVQPGQRTKAVPQEKRGEENKKHIKYR